MLTFKDFLNAVWMSGYIKYQAVLLNALNISSTVKVSCYGKCLKQKQGKMTVDNIVSWHATLLSPERKPISSKQKNKTSAFDSSYIFRRQGIGLW